MLPGQQFAGDSAYLLMSHDVIWTNRMQVFCIEVQQWGLVPKVVEYSQCVQYE